MFRRQLGSHEVASHAGTPSEQGVRTFVRTSCVHPALFWLRECCKARIYPFKTVRDVQKPGRVRLRHLQAQRVALRRRRPNSSEYETAAEGALPAAAQFSDLRHDPPDNHAAGLISPLDGV
jgi:hypothetical protein